MVFTLCMRGKLGCGVYAVYVGKARMWCLRCVCGESSDVVFTLCMWGKLGCGVYAVYVGKARMWCLRCVCGES